MNIVVLAGGTSTERMISIVSGTGICHALRKKGHRAILIDIFGGVPCVDWDDPFPEEYDVEAAASFMHTFDKDIKETAAARKSFWGENVLALCEKADFVFLGLHGMNGEDGRVQASFDLMGIRYSGAGYLSSGMAMDKTITKDMFRNHGVPTPPGVSFTKDTVVKKPEEAGLHFPVVVKTCCGGSSVGVYIVHDQQAYERAVQQAFLYEDELVLEQYIKGDEYTVAVVDGTAYPIVQIKPKQGFYDYHNKYEPGSTEEICPAPLSEEDTKRMQEIALDAWRALSLDAYARFDFMMDAEGNMFCLEANTLPGMTPTSLIPQEAQALGIDYPSLCEELIRVSLKRYEE
ncbi:MAG: D-alanine--D-alanine ligase [Blautia sp.]|nr:D-alanine--D-alanine ligase [Blautia sp.]